MSTSNPPFTLDELLAYLREDEERRDGYLTSREWAAHLGVSHKKMMGLLHEASEKGILLLQRAFRTKIDGTSQPVPVYAFSIKEEMGEGIDSKVDME